jgi:Trypsin-like peptidase domain
LKLTCASIYAGGIQMSADTQAAIESTAGAAQVSLTPTEQLMYSTIRLHYEGNGTLHWGTGFLFKLFEVGNQFVPVIVTNKHVVANMKECHFSFASRDSNGMPNPTSHIPVTITDFGIAWLPHPSVDLAIIPLAKSLGDIASKQPFAVYLDQTLIPTDQEFNDFTPVEQVLTVGFPGLLWDEVHNLPIFHRGYTATAPYIDFKGHTEFLIDFSTWPGASGSPVLLYNDNGWTDRRGNTFLGSLRVKLIGVVYGVATQGVNGNVTIQNGPTSVALPGQMSVPTNLGACIRAHRILEFEPLLVKQGFIPPAGYNMRAK